MLDGMLRKREKGTYAVADVVRETTVECVVINVRSKFIGVRLIECEAIALI